MKVGVGVGVDVGLIVGVFVFVGVLVGVCVGVSVIVGVTVIVGVIDGVGVTVIVGVTDGVGVGLTAGVVSRGTFAIIPATHTGRFPEIPRALLICACDGPFTDGFEGFEGLYIYFNLIGFMEKGSFYLPYPQYFFDELRFKSESTRSQHCIQCRYSSLRKLSD